jgi:hypothetical protein
MNIVKQNLQKLLSDDILFKEITQAHPWGFILESSKQQYKVMPQSQWNQSFYKNHWSFSLLK